MSDQESDSGLDSSVEQINQLMQLDEGEEQQTVVKNSSIEHPAPPRKRGRPRKQVDPNTIVQKPPKQPKKPAPPRIPKRTLNSLEPKNLVSFSSEDIEHVRTIQRRIQTCIGRNVRYLQTLPENLSLILPGSEIGEQLPASPFDGIQAINPELPQGTAQMTVEQFCLDLLPFHIYSSLRESPSSFFCKDASDPTLLSVEHFERQSDEILLRADRILLEQDEKSAINPLELLLIEKKLFLEEEKYILSFLKQEFFKKYGIQYSSSLMQQLLNSIRPAAPPQQTGSESAKEQEESEQEESL